MYIEDEIAYAGEPVSGMKVKAIKVLGNLCMLVTFTTGEVRLLDATELFDIPAFRVLEDEDVFKTAYVDHGVVCWVGGDIDIAPEAMYSKSHRYDRIA